MHAKQPMSHVQNWNFDQKTQIWNMNVQVEIFMLNHEETCFDRKWNIFHEFWIKNVNSI